MSEIVRKLSSRKLWLAIAGVATGIATILGADAGEIGTVAGAVVSLASVVVYIMTEGRIDAEGVKQAVEAVQGAADVIGSGIDTDDAEPEVDHADAG